MCFLRQAPIFVEGVQVNNLVIGWVFATGLLDISESESEVRKVKVIQSECH